MIKKIGGYIVLAVLSLLLFFGAKQWIDNKNLRIQMLEESLQKTQKELKDTREELSKRNESNDAGTKVVEDLDDKKKADQTDHSKAAEDVRKKVAEIEKKYKDKEDNANNRAMKETEIAVERARGLWRSYCIAEPTAKECVTNK